jgi:hypothetical protein
MSYKTPTKDMKAPEEVSSSTKNSSDMKFLHFFTFFWGGGTVLACLDPDSGSANPFVSVFNRIRNILVF